MLVFSFFRQTMSKSKFKKGTVQKEKGLLHEGWETQFYIVAVKDILMCLICNSMIATVKKYNVF